MKVTAMRLLASALFLMLLGLPCTIFAQAPNLPPASVQAAQSPSATMQPALDDLQQVLGSLRPDKWKGPGEVREEASANIDSIHRDLQGTLPSLLATADAAPNSVAQILPAFRNIEALYDVLLRVTEAGNLFAPTDQRQALEQTRAKLEEARRSLGERVQTLAVTHEKQIHDLQTAVHTMASAPAPVCPAPPPPVKKRSTRRKPAKKQAQAPEASKGATPSH